MATVTKKRTVMSVAGKVQVIRYTENGKKKKPDLCREFGLVNFTIQAVCKNLTAEDRWNVYSSQILTVILKLKLMME